MAVNCAAVLITFSISAVLVYWYPISLPDITSGVAYAQEGNGVSGWPKNVFFFCLLLRSLFSLSFCLFVVFGLCGGGGRRGASFRLVLANCFAGLTCQLVQANKKAHTASGPTAANTR
jgi:hypothetical protein